MNHHVHPELLSRPVRVLVAGTGDLGIATVMLLPYLHRSLLSSAHPGGLEVTVLDSDTVSHAARRTQPFHDADVGEPKSLVIVERVNGLWGLEWRGMADDLVSVEQLESVDILVSCVTSGKTREAIAECLAASAVDYWLDLTARPDGAQFVLGEPLNQRNRQSSARVHVVSELLPETVRPRGDDLESLGDDPGDPRHGVEGFIANVVAGHALMLLGRLLLRGAVGYHGGFVGPRGRVQLLRVVPRPLDPAKELNRAGEID